MCLCCGSAEEVCPLSERTVVVDVVSNFDPSDVLVGWLTLCSNNKWFQSREVLAAVHEDDLADHDGGAVWNETKRDATRRTESTATPVTATRPLCVWRGSAAATAAVVGVVGVTPIVIVMVTLG